MLTYAIAALGLGLYISLTWILTGLLGLKGKELMIVRIGLTLIGLIAAAVCVWFVKRREKEAAEPAMPEPSASGGQVDFLIREANQRLASSSAGTRLSGLPVFLVLGESGSTKTSIIANSGLDAELIAGQAHQDSNVVPTPCANIWYARGAAFVEAGGPLLANEEQLSRLIAYLKPGRLASLVGKSAQSPRAAIVCVDVSQVGSGEAALASARRLNSILASISAKFAIRLPVYVLFTKCDRVPFFAEYVRNLGRDEATQVFGCTLLLEPSSGGVYSERESQRFGALLQGLVHDLCEKRLDYMARELEPFKRPDIYEFPREFRKLRDHMVRYLVELGRPSQLRAAHFLRGFYFTGVRPIVVDYAAPAPAAQQPQAGSFSGEATSLFKAAAPRPAAPAPAPGGSRRVPQWTFLSHFFADVLLQDRGALGASGQNVRASLFRRLLLAGGIFLLLVYIVGATVSFFNNRALQTEIADASRALAAARDEALQLPSSDSLKRLDRLRASVEKLSLYEREGAPLSLRWGLYSGGGLYPAARRVYFARFADLLFRQTQAGLLSQLRALPRTPGPDDKYDGPYAALKAYLITTSNPDKSTSEFLTPVLSQTWLAGRAIDPERKQLADRQFDFYANELKFSNPYSSDNDAVAIDRARAYLNQFAGSRRVYQFMLAEASRANPPINFNKQLPGSADVVVVPREVPGAFSKKGWAFMQDAIKNADKYFAGERWVLGPDAGANIDRAKLEQELRAFYNADFKDAWRAFLASANVVRYGSIKEAAVKLAKTSGPTSPLLALFAVVSQNTGVESDELKQIFQPSHQVVPPTVVDQYIGGDNQPYMNALLNLQSSLDQLAAGPAGMDSPLAGQTYSNAGQAKVVALSLAQKFRPDNEGHVEATVTKLLLAPITYVESLVQKLGPQQLNGAGATLCAALNPILKKYPFTMDAKVQATLQELNSVFQPGQGTLWTLYQDAFSKVLMRQGTEYAARPDSPFPIRPQFVSFFNRAAAVTQALYADGSPNPRLAYSMRAMPSEGISKLVLQVDGQSAKLGDAQPQQFVWPSNSVRVTIDSGTQEYDGPWGAFAFFADADEWNASGAGYNVAWPVLSGARAQPLRTASGAVMKYRFYLDLRGAPPVFRKGYLAGLQCVSQVAQ